MKEIENADQIKAYVAKNYPALKDKTMYITEYKNHYSVKTHPEGAPIPLSKNIVA